MILEYGDLGEADGELLTAKSGDGWTWFLLGDQLPRLTIRMGGCGKRADTTYDVAQLGMDPGFDGHGFRIEKRSGGTDDNDRQHDVIIPHDREQPAYCTCRGFQRWQRCKHTAALRAIVLRGLIATNVIPRTECAA